MPFQKLILRCSQSLVSSRASLLTGRHEALKKVGEVHIDSGEHLKQKGQLCKLKRGI